MNLDFNLSLVLPEVVLLSALFLVLLVDLWVDDSKRVITHYLSLAALAITMVVQLCAWQKLPAFGFNNMFVADGISQFTKLVAYGATFALFVYSKPYNKMRGIFKGEYYTLSMFALVGVSVMMGAAHFLSAYIGLELLSLSLYAMIALRRDSAQAAEAALKYFVLGALASGLLLYGISMIYGATGSLEFTQIASVAASNEVNGWLLKLGTLFVVIAIAFKFGAVPFHMWVPDVYQGSPTSVAAFIGSVPKIAAVVFAYRILAYGLAAEMGNWVEMFAILAVLSLLIGNLAAIVQSNIKRMFAFSTVSHMGFVLLGLQSGVLGMSAALYYATAYILMSLVGFGVLMLLSQEDQECENIADLAGLNQCNAWYAAAMSLALFSMAGIPPLMGFYAKFVVLQALLASSSAYALPVAVFAVVMSLIGAFYYLRVVKAIYFDQAENTAPLGGDCASKVLLSINVILLLLLGVFPSGVMAWIEQAMRASGL